MSLCFLNFLLNYLFSLKIKLKNKLKASRLRGGPIGAIPIGPDADLSAIATAEVLFTCAMNFATAAALLDENYHHQLTPYVIGMTVFQGVLGQSNAF